MSSSLEFDKKFDLKYGANPHQGEAAVLMSSGKELPFKILSGKPGYINLLDALNAWQLVKELKAATGLAAAASFKHVSPAGAAVAVPLTADERAVYEVPDSRGELTPAATAYIRARNADPMSSFGDFAALSDVVDEKTALTLKHEVSDGIIAPGYEPAALAVLAAKKGGNFCVLEADPLYEPPSAVEHREVYGVCLRQQRNRAQFSRANLLQWAEASGVQLTDDEIRDLLVACVSVKYTQSNSVGYASRGQMIGVGAGQQSRVDCVKLAGRKLRVWLLRQHPRVRQLPFKSSVKRQDRVNARVQFIEGDFAGQQDRDQFDSLFEGPPPALLTADELDQFVGQPSSTGAGIALVSDAFFPFRDSIDHAARFGVTVIAQPGGSVKDDEVKAAAQQHKIKMVLGVPRIFHH